MDQIQGTCEYSNVKIVQDLIVQYSHYTIITVILPISVVQKVQTFESAHCKTQKQLHSFNNQASEQPIS